MQFSPTKYNLVRQNEFLVRQNEFLVRQKHRAYIFIYLFIIYVACSRIDQKLSQISKI
jgi:uncharacterized membrane protein